MKIEMNNSDRLVVAQLEAMPLDQGRRELASGTFGRPGSLNHSFASSWLAVKEAEERDKREAESLSISRKALQISYAAIIIAIMAIVFPIIVAWLTKN